jgi:hypothetical protein
MVGVVRCAGAVLSLADQTGLGALLGASGSGRRRFDQER